MKSKIYMEDLSLNIDKKPMENDKYYKSFVVFSDGSEGFACFTEHEMNKAIRRGEKNLEDKPAVKSWFSKLLSW